MDELVSTYSIVFAIPSDAQTRLRAAASKISGNRRSPSRPAQRLAIAASGE